MVEVDEVTRRRAITLFERGLSLLDGGRPLAAWRAGRRLCRYRYSGSYELRGRALAALGKLRLGRLVLERGAKRVPHAAEVWHQLGILRSEMADYSAALEAFDRGLATDGADPCYLLLNKAVVFQRMERPAEALKILAQIPQSEQEEREGLAVHVAMLRRNIEDEIRRSARPRRWRLPWRSR